MTKLAMLCPIAFALVREHAAVSQAQLHRNITSSGIAWQSELVRGGLVGLAVPAEFHLLRFRCKYR
jgi:hypothetical protein